MRGKTVVEFPGIMPNPTYEKVQEGARIAREEGVDFILAVGGGSVFDCCKIVSAQALLDEDIDDFEHVQDKTPTAFIPLGAWSRSPAPAPSRTTAASSLTKPPR